MTLQNMEKGILAGGETGVVEGQALYHDGTGALVTCGISDEYHFAGFCHIITDGEAASVVYLYAEGDVGQALGDGANAYTVGQMVQLGAAGVIVQYTPIRSYDHTVSAAEEAVDTITVDPNVSHIVALTNSGAGGGQAGDYLINGNGGTLAGSDVNQELDDTLDFLNPNIQENDILTIDYIPKRGAVAKVIADANIGDPVYVKTLNYQ